MGTCWVDVDCMSLSIGDIVRVKIDAYSGDIGKMHNGRLVKVIEIRDGDVHVSTADYKLPYLNRARHAAYRLERKIVTQ